MAALLGDGLHRLAGSTEPTSSDIAARMSLVVGEATHYLRSAEPVDVIYLDPMFPTAGRSAGVRKEMQLFRELLLAAGHSDADARAQEAALLQAALAHASYRVVVKRMKQTPLIDGTPPGYQLKGKAVRYDIYPSEKILLVALSFPVGRARHAVVYPCNKLRIISS